MRALMISLCVVLATFVSTTGFAEDNDHAAQLLNLVGLIDQIPTRAQLIAAGSGEDGAALRSIAVDEDLLQYHRLRAVHMLAHFPSETNAAFAREIAVSPAALTEMRVASLFVYSSYMETVSEADVDRLVAQLLRDSDPEVQSASIRAVGRLAPERGDVILNEFLQSSPVLTPSVQRELERTIRQ